MAKHAKTLYKRSNKKQKSNFFELLKWILSFSLIILSIYFMKDVWTKFEKKTTSFNTFRETLNELPTTVLCFSPFAKESIFDGKLNEYFQIYKKFIIRTYQFTSSNSGGQNFPWNLCPFRIFIQSSEKIESKFEMDSHFSASPFCATSISDYWSIFDFCCYLQNAGARKMETAELAG